MLLLIGLPLAAAILGWLGGSGDTTVRVDGPAVRMEVETPAILRSGNWFETRVRIHPKEDVGDLTIAFSQDLWRGMSIDTLIPDAEKVEATDGAFAYSFGPLRKDEAFLLKIDGQIQPRGFRRLSGPVEVRDGERELASVRLTLTVLP